jgi:proto-chlorophyllide reductase subunit
MKFLCVPCDSPMKLQTVGPPDRGSLSVVYACPECGYEMAMLTNAYETQLVQSLGVRIGPDAASAAPASGKCPFTTMVPTQSEQREYLAPANERERVSHANGAGPGAPASERVAGAGGAKPPGLSWTAEAEARLANVPEFVRPMARLGIEKYAREQGALEVDEKMLDAARDFFGM